VRRRWAIGALCAAALTACFKKPELTELAPAGTRLVIHMPQPARHQTKEAEFAGIRVTAQAWSSEFDGVAYIVNSQAIPPELKAQWDKQPRHLLLDNARDHFVRSMQAKLDQETGVELRTPSGAWMGRELTLSRPEGLGKIVARLFLTDDTYYQLVANLPAKPGYNQDLYAARFLESARLR
jgi:hypothetical protein